MAKSFSFIVLLGLLVVVVAKKEKKKQANAEAAEPPAASCTKEEGQIAQLEKELEVSKTKAENDIKKLIEELTDARQAVTASKSKTEGDLAKLTNELKEANKLKCEPFSVVDPVVSTYRFVVDAGNQLLERTTLDEQLVSGLTLAYDHGKKYSAEVYGKVSSVDYAKHIQDIHSHEVYRTQIAPYLEKAQVQLKPHLDEHVYPNIEKVRVQMGPHLESAQVLSAALLKRAQNEVKRAQDEVMPVVKTASSKAIDFIYELPYEKAINPIFEAAEKIAPNQAHALPKKTLDRAFALLIALYVLCKSLSWSRVILRVVFFFVRIFFKIFLFALRLCVVFPLRIFFKLLRITMCIGTCFHCCCLCRRKSKVNDLKAKADNTDDKKAAPAGVPATAAEVQQLLETCKKEKKSLDDAAKQLAKFVKNGKPLEKPDKMKGKTLSKDTVLKACAKFKEIDVKKLSL